MCSAEVATKMKQNGVATNKPTVPESATTNNIACRNSRNERKSAVESPSPYRDWDWEFVQREDAKEDEQSAEASSQIAHFHLDVG